MSIIDPAYTPDYLLPTEVLFAGVKLVTVKA